MRVLLGVKKWLPSEPISSHLRRGFRNIIKRYMTFSVSHCMISILMLIDVVVL